MINDIKKLRRLIKEIINEELSKPKYGFHVAPKEYHNQIEDNGIIPLGNRKNIHNDPTSTRVYIWGDLDVARWFQDFKGRNEYEIWEVNLKGLDIKPDPETKDMSSWSSRFDGSYNWAGWYYEGIINPSRIFGTIN